MPPRTVRGDREGWQRVAARVTTRRIQELGLNADDVVERSGRRISLTVLSLIENARQDAYATRVIAGLCAALDWTSDSIERVLAGGEPVEVEHESRAEPSEQDRRLDRLERELAALRAELGLPPRQPNGDTEPRSA